jgi:hypothetical protein
MVAQAGFIGEKQSSDQTWFAQVCKILKRK